ncbi:hypothetical protein B4589_017795 (plasmid) [Halolamina sp. CBA1230]|uniref:surface glycoprotein n=1 Tax=Halolamina sp. CBA1230 TaxID=1853690 RepID=UPI0009A15CF1|nr:surface glycoprotein [Halolamina sp. CBA1230]QKY22255.1 hypothetical protein B4589_017795 [Halolamina sp. CBA1230]
MTNTNEKVRALFLTALMVFSVVGGTVAFAGGAAAAANNASISNSQPVQPSDNTDVQYDANANVDYTVGIDADNNGTIEADEVLDTTTQTAGTVTVTVTPDTADGIDASTNGTFDVAIIEESDSDETTDAAPYDVSAAGATTTLQVDGVAPTISNVTLGNSSGNLALSFNSSEQLSSATVDVSSPNSGSAWQSYGVNDFTETVTDGTYTYELSVSQAYNDGEGPYTATVSSAVDEAGNDAGASTLNDTYVYSPLDTVLIDGEISDKSLRAIAESENVSVTIVANQADLASPITVVDSVPVKKFNDPAWVANNPYVESARFINNGEDQIDSYVIELDNFGDNTEYTINADLDGFNAFDGTVTLSAGGTTTQHLRLTRIVDADELTVTEPDDGTSVGLQDTIDSTVLVETEDTSENGLGTLAPLEGEEVTTSVVSTTNPNAAGVTVDVNPAPNTTVGDGTTQFDISLSLGQSIENYDEDITTQIKFQATTSSESDTLNVTFNAKPPSGNGEIIGDISKGDEASLVDGVNVHAVTLNRLQENQDTLQVEQDDTDYVRVGMDTDGDDAAEEWLDVQTEYLVTSSEASVTQNLSISGSGFSVAETKDDANADFSISVLEAGDYVVHVSDDGDFSSLEHNVTFTAANNLTYEATTDRYDGVAADHTAVSDDDGRFGLHDLYTDGEAGLEYVVMAGDGNGGLSLVDDQVTVKQPADSTDEQSDVGLNVQEVEITADSVNVTNLGTVPSADDADANYTAVLDLPEEDNSDSVRQEIPRDNSTVDVIDLRTFLSEGDITEGANVTVSYTVTDGSFDGEFLDTVVGGDVISTSDGQIQIDTSAETDGMADGEAVLFLQTDKDGFGSDANVTIDVTMNNAAGADSTDKEFVGVLDQAYQSGSITGVVSDDDDNPVDAEIYVSEMVDPQNSIEITFTPDDVDDLNNFTATVYDTTTDPNTPIEQVNLTAEEMRNFEFQGFSSDLSLAAGEESYTLLADRQADRTTLSPVPALEADTISERVRFALTGVSETGATGTSVSTGVQVNRTSTASIVIAGAEQPFFQVSDLSPMNVTVTQGDEIDVSANITNVGDLTGTQTVEFRVAGQTLASEVSLSGGETTTVEFTNISTSSLDAGNYTHGVYTADGDQTGTLTIESNSSGDVGYDDVMDIIQQFNNGNASYEDVMDAIAQFNSAN